MPRISHTIYTCPSCSYKTENRCSFEKHELIHLSEKIYSNSPNNNNELSKSLNQPLNSTDASYRQPDSPTLSSLPRNQVSTPHHVLPSMTDNDVTSSQIDKSASLSNSPGCSELPLKSEREESVKPTSPAETC